MTRSFIEHINLSVGNPERTAGYLMRLFGWRIGWRGPAANGGNAIHVGNDHFYLAVYALHVGNAGPVHQPSGQPFNKIGLVVDNFDEVERRVVAEGYSPYSGGDHDTRRRFLFSDDDGIEFEIVDKSDNRRSWRSGWGRMARSLIEMQGLRTHSFSEKQ